MPLTADPGGQNRPPQQRLHGTTMTQGATLDEAQQIGEVVLEVLKDITMAEN